VRLFFQKKKIVIPQAVSGRQPAHPAADYHHIMPRRGGRPGKTFAAIIADFMADPIVFTIHVCRMSFLVVGALRG
jgi:hypothetical protein